MSKEIQRDKVILEKATVVLVSGVSQKTGNSYHMLRIETNNEALNNSLKPIFLDLLQVDALMKL